MKKVILFVIVVGLTFISCHKEEDNTFPSGFLDFFPYETNMEKEYTDGKDTITMTIEKFEIQTSGCHHHSYSESGMSLECSFSNTFLYCNVQFFFFCTSNYNTHNSCEEDEIFSWVDVDDIKNLSKLSIYEIKTKQTNYILQKDKGITEIRLADGETWTLIE
ncbi:MAG: hypothetical protein MJ069_04750 [Salinivirgaceae bacterium]|nr:hypothetical protein [Salinivirgaceae bacterium]